MRPIVIAALIMLAAPAALAQGGPPKITSPPPVPSTYNVPAVGDVVAVVANMSGDGYTTVWESTQCPEEDCSACDNGPASCPASCQIVGYDGDSRASAAPLPSVRRVFLAVVDSLITYDAVQAPPSGTTAVVVRACLPSECPAAWTVPAELLDEVTGLSHCLDLRNGGTDLDDYPPPCAVGTGHEAEDPFVVRLGLQPGDDALMGEGE